MTDEQLMTPGFPVRWRDLDGNYHQGTIVGVYDPRWKSVCTVIVQGSYVLVKESYEHGYTLALISYLQPLPIRED